MKKFLFLLLTVFAVTACDDECDHQVKTTPSEDDFPVGSWYNEEMNEEDNYNKSGTFYSKFCTINIAGEQEGTYEVGENGKKLTWYYKYMGQNQVVDWTITNQNDYTFMMNSNYSSLLYGKIVESYSLKVGQTQQIMFPSVNGIKVNTYGSGNERIAKVSTSGLISAVGEKGTTYIKLVTNKGDVWVKVVVGNECADLWYDFISMIGYNYNEVKSVLGSPYVYGDDGYSFAYKFSQHNLIDNVIVLLDKKTNKVIRIVLTLKSAASESEVLSYLGSRYYPYEEDNSYIYYINNNSYDNSVVGIVYEKSSKMVYFVML